MILFFVGFISFLLAGLGLGGGVLLIPILTSLFSYDQSFAQYAALLAYIPAALSIILFSIKKEKETYIKIIRLIPVGIIGAIIGAIIAQNINVSFLKKIYAVFLIVVGVKMCFNVFLNKKKSRKSAF